MYERSGSLNLPIHYSTEPMIKVDECLKTKAKRLICVYGEYNPWSASAARIENNLNTLKVYAAKGSHGSRISSLSEDQKVTIINKLYEWLGLPIPVKD